MDYESMSRGERKEAINALQKQMQEAAELLDFELAAQMRDLILELKLMD
ncbi:uvrB/uvrC motif family protein [Streptococcus pyogenes AA472]|nr:uvrB/uvrC motif family protein [Streptococcus pyogenes AA472]